VKDHRSVLLYDEDCGFCRWFTDRLMRWDRGRQLRPAPLQGSEARVLLAGVPEERRMASWHLVDPDGRVHSAGAAIGPLLRSLPRGRGTARVADRFPRGTRTLYAAIARNRGLLGRVVGARACSVHPRDPNQPPVGTPAAQRKDPGE
jgi:predicted DCC family thiol-disulfide oxidoreductase YuxK